VFVDAVDIDFAALACTQKNAVKHDVQARVRTLCADLFDPAFCERVSPLYDAVISNPPYVTAAEHATLQPEVREHEARHALVAGADGLAFYHRIAELIPHLLKPGGLLAVEIGAGQAERVVREFREAGAACRTVADGAGIERIVIGRRA
jgi:release factor glutamine methyltransferase